MPQNISNRKTFHSFNCGSWSWWRWYWSFTWIHNAFETLQRTKIIVTISTTIIFRWQLLFYWWWTWCSNRYFRTSWTCWRWCVCCTQHICFVFFFVSLFKNHHKLILQNLIDWSKCTQCLIAHANTFLELFLFLLSLHLQHKLFYEYPLSLGRQFKPFFISLLPKSAEQWIHWFQVWNPLYCSNYT